MSPVSLPRRVSRLGIEGRFVPCARGILFALDTACVLQNVYVRGNGGVTGKGRCIRFRRRCVDGSEGCVRGALE